MITFLFTLKVNIKSRVPSKDDGVKTHYCMLYIYSKAMLELEER